MLWGRSYKVVAPPALCIVGGFGKLSLIHAPNRNTDLCVSLRYWCHSGLCNFASRRSRLQPRNRTVVLRYSVSDMHRQLVRRQRDILQSMVCPRLYTVSFPRVDLLRDIGFASKLSAF